MLLSIEHVHKTYPGGRPVLQDVSLSLDHGQTLALTGEIAPEEPAELSTLPTERGVPALGSNATEDPVDRLRAMIGDKQDETVEILRSWLEEERA